MAFRDQPLGELALTIPRASALFRQYDMDYCCGGKQTLARAASRKALDVAVIEAELAKLAEEPVPRLARRPWRRSSTISSFAITTGTANSCRS
jgi:regulator of cell morphogenesis and NO signaling